MPKTIAYIRVSTHEQDVKKNRSDILEFANDKKLGNVDFVEEINSGKLSWKKRKIKNIIDTLKKGIGVGYLPDPGQDIIAAGLDKPAAEYDHLGIEKMPDRYTGLAQDLTYMVYNPGHNRIRLLQGLREDTAFDIA